MSTFPTLESEHLILRRLDLSDAPLVYEYMKEREIAYNMLLIPHPYPEGAAEEWITRSQEAGDKGEHFTFAVTRKADDLFMGSCGIVSNQEHKRAEIGYWVGKRFWGQGYMSE